MSEQKNNNSKPIKKGTSYPVSLDPKPTAPAPNAKLPVKSPPKSS